MPEELNMGSLRPNKADRSKAGVPSEIADRYFTDPQGGPGLGFYRDRSTATPAFRDEGRRLITGRADPKAIADMAAIARHRGWTKVVLSGSPEFRREAWLAARREGLEVGGYRPTSRDLQALERRQRRARSATDRGERAPPPSPPSNRAFSDPMTVVETVVRARIAASDQREAILQRARARLAIWLDRLITRDDARNPGRASRARAPERDRAARR